MSCRSETISIADLDGSISEAVLQRLPDFVENPMARLTALFTAPDATNRADKLGTHPPIARSIAPRGAWPSLSVPVISDGRK